MIRGQDVLVIVHSNVTVSLVSSSDQEVGYTVCLRSRRGVPQYSSVAFYVLLRGVAGSRLFRRL
jgi:hypothetical protein